MPSYKLGWFQPSLPSGSRAKDSRAMGQKFEAWDPRHVEVCHPSLQVAKYLGLHRVSPSEVWKIISSVPFGGFRVLEARFRSLLFDGWCGIRALNQALGVVFQAEGR